MTGDQHYKAAETQLDAASDCQDQDWREAMYLLRAAQVHATLAQAAKTHELIDAVKLVPGAMP